MVKLNRALSGLLVAVALVAACRDPLMVQNYNNPQRTQVYARPGDVEALIYGSYRSMSNGTFGVDGIGPSARAMSWENASNLNNWGMGPRSAVPRTFIDNGRGNLYLNENLTEFNSQQRAARAAADGLNRLYAGLSLGSASQDARAKAFGWFVIGCGLTNVGLAYDSAAIPSPFDDLSYIPPLSSYTDVVAAALVAFDSALANTANATASFPLPTAWLNGNTTTQAQFRELIYSWKARARADVARDPTERAAVNWTEVHNDAARGLSADFRITVGGGSGWTAQTNNQWYLFQQWTQVNQLIAGMADVSGSYETWLRAWPNGTPFVVLTPDLRWPQGASRAAQQAASPAVPTGRLYFRNRTGADSPADPWSSFYDWYRMKAWADANYTGPYPVFVKAQNDLLLAEAHLRLPTPDIAEAARLIDLTRVPNGLPALVGQVATLNDPVPGGGSCVPRVPTRATSPRATVCGNIMEAMKWEYRMETMYLSWISQYFASRGWGDLPEGTPIHWPVPYQEMDARRHPFYNMGGVGRTGGAVGVGTYGF